MNIMCVILYLFSALSCRVGALQIMMIMMMIMMMMVMMVMMIIINLQYKLFGKERVNAADN